MKFEYQTEDSEVVAVIWATHLVVKGDSDEALVLCSDSTVSRHAFCDRDFDYYLTNSSTSKKFYKGDKITITF